MADDQYWKDQFERIGNNPRYWRLSAHELLVAAKILKDEYDLELRQMRSKQGEASDNLFLPGPKMLLMGAAMEALLKALAIDRGHRFVKDGKFRQVAGGTSHNLVGIAKHTLFDLSDQEEEFLERLGLYLERGRYPIAVEWSKWLRDHPDREVGKLDNLYSSSNDDKLFAGLIKRLGSQVKWTT